MYGNVFGHVNKYLVTYVRSLNTSMLIYTLFSTHKHPVIDMHSPYTYVNQDVITYVRSLNTSMLIYTLFSNHKHPLIDMHSPYALPYTYTPASQPTSVQK